MNLDKYHTSVVLQELKEYHREAVLEYLKKLPEIQKSVFKSQYFENDANYPTKINNGKQIDICEYNNNINNFCEKITDEELIKKIPDDELYKVKLTIEMMNVFGFNNS